MIENFTSQQWRLLTKFIQDPVKFKNDSTIYTEAIKEIDSLDLDGRDFRERAAMYRNNLKKVPLCKCGNKVKFDIISYKWAKTCGQKCYLSDIKQGAKSVSVYGKVYDSLSDAAKEHSNLYEQLYDVTNKDVFYVNNHSETCYENLKKGNILLTNKDWLEEQKRNRVSIHKLKDALGVSRELVNNAFLFFGISKSYDQLSYEANTIILNAELFKSEFEEFGSEVMAKKYNCSPTTILIRARELDCKMSRTVSAIELELKTYIETLGIEVLQSDRTAINRELDLYIPSKQTAIELDGLFWHSEWDTNTNRNRHKEKYLLCKEKGITLLRFTDYETTNKLNIVKSMIASKLGVSSRLYARNCVLREVSGSDARLFLDCNHISGYSASSVNLGLYHDDVLVMMMTFAKPRFSKKYDWEVVRMASVLNTNVVGGASKLLAYFRNMHQGSILSYSDNRTGNGSSYSKLGFVLEGETSPGYFYVKNNQVYSRFMFQKNNIEKMCTVYDVSKTEFENAIANGYGRYWDCGNKIWVMQ